MLSVRYSVATVRNRFDMSPEVAAVSIQERFSRSSLSVISGIANKSLRKRRFQESSHCWGVAKSICGDVSEIEEDLRNWPASPYQERSICTERKTSLKEEPRKSVTLQSCDRISPLWPEFHPYHELERRLGRSDHPEHIRRDASVQRKRHARLVYTSSRRSKASFLKPVIPLVRVKASLTSYWKSIVFMSTL